MDNKRKDQVNNRLIDFEMEGITQRQKDVMKREIQLLLTDAARRRDALEVHGINAMKERLDAIKLNRPINIFDYIKDIFIESRQRIYTLFDIVGIGLFFFPSVAETLITNASYARLVGGIIFFLSFVGANYNLYKKLS